LLSLYSTTTTSSEAGSLLALKTSQGMALSHLEAQQQLEKDQLGSTLLAQGVPASQLASTPQYIALLQQQSQMRSAMVQQNSKNMGAYTSSKALAPRVQHVHKNQHHQELVPGQAATQVTTSTSTTTSSEAPAPVKVATLKSTPVKHVHTLSGHHGAAPTQTTTTTTSTTTSSEALRPGTGGAPLAQSAGVQGVQSGLQDLYEAGQQKAWTNGVGVVNGVGGQVVPEWGAHSWVNAASGTPVTTAQVQGQVDTVYAQLTPEQQAELNANINAFENKLGGGSPGGPQPTKGWVAQAAGQQAQQTQVGPGTPQLVPAGTPVTAATDSAGSGGVVTNFIKRVLGKV
jgi:hypothetical protein